MRSRLREIPDEDRRRRERVLRVARKAERGRWRPVEPEQRLPLEPEHPELPLWEEEES